jgi:hypothetical protein
MAARIIPRVIRKRNMTGLQNNAEGIDKSQFSDRMEMPRDERRDQIKRDDRDNSKKQSHAREDITPESKEMMVLGQIRHGYNTFDVIRKNTGFSREELNSILERFEKDQMIRVEQKKGMFGIKVVMSLTKKGYRKYDS